MKQEIMTVRSNASIAAGVFDMRLEGDTSAVTAPGQFVNIAVKGCFLRRPISVCDAREGELRIIYKAVGRGTGIMSGMQPGEKLDLLVGLGNGYDMGKSGDRPLLIAGGVGVPPMYLLAEKLIESGRTVTAALGFNTESDVFLADELEALGARVLVATADGSVGKKGFVTDLLPDLDYTFFYACGPEPMFRAVSKAVKTKGQYSFEERMGCGFGACMGCSCETLAGSKRICRDGPVMESEEIIWEK